MPFPQKTTIGNLKKIAAQLVASGQMPPLEEVLAAVNEAKKNFGPAVEAAHRSPAEPILPPNDSASPTARPAAPSKGGEPIGENNSITVEPMPAGAAPKPKYGLPTDQRARELRQHPGQETKTT